MSEARGADPGLLRRNAISNVVGRSASVLLWVLVTPVVLSRLGPERFAVWSLFLGLGGNVATLDFGMGNAVARHMALSAAHGDRPNLRLVLRRSLALSAGIGLLWCLASMAGRGVLIRAFHVPLPLQPEVSRSLLLFAVSMFVFSVTQVLTGALVGLQRLDLQNLCFLSGLALHATVLLVGLSLGMGLIAIAFAAISGHMLSGTLAALLVRRSMRNLHTGPPRERVTWREMLNFGGAVQGTAVCAVGQQQAWSYLLGALGQLRWVTEFSLGYRVANAVWSLPTLVQGAVIPAAAHASASGDHDRVRTVYAWACRWIFALGGLVLGGLWLTAPAVGVLWLGPQQVLAMAGSVTVVRLLAIAFAVATISGPATAVARGGGWPLLETLNFAIALAINVLMSVWLVPRMGPAGAAIAMGVSYGLAGAWLFVTMHRVLNVATGRWLWTLVLPRFALPALAAGTLHMLWPMALPGSRMDALRILLLQGGAYTLITAALLWPTGDPAVLLSRLRAGHRTSSRDVPGEGHS